MSAKAEKFGRYLRELRGKTPQHILADAIDRTTIYISNVENGKNLPPDFDQLNKIATVLKLSDEKRLELIDEAALARNTVAQDIFDKLCQHKELLHIVRQITPDTIEQLKMRQIKFDK